MECNRGNMSLSPPKVIFTSPEHSLGAGDSAFQSIIGVQTQKLTFSSSPVQIFRQRYWFKSPRQRTLKPWKCFETEKGPKRKVKSTIHASLEDLRKEHDHICENDRRKSTPSIINDMEVIHSKGESSRELAAARKIYGTLLLNAWRKRKQDLEGLATMFQNQNSELERAQMNLAFLKSMLKKETQASQHAYAEIAVLTARLEEEIKSKEALSQDKSFIEHAFMELEDKLSHEMTLRSNALNELLQVKNEQALLETQLQKERDKLLKLRDEMAEAVAKVTLLEEIISAKNSWIEHMRKTNEDLEAEWASREKSKDECIEAEKARNEQLTEEVKNLQSAVKQLNDDKKTLEDELSKEIENAKVQNVRLLKLENDLSLKDKQHEEDIQKYGELLSQVLHERRELELMENRQEARLNPKRILNGIIALPMNLVNSVYTAVWPYNNRRDARNS